ncbi:hypothetical protein DESC_590004 [Desulfosarcina cetonica]|nr:hypothetical protein DESC_590004 [Desulfosarcina cetonica]
MLEPTALDGPDEGGVDEIAPFSLVFRQDDPVGFVGQVLSDDFPVRGVWRLGLHPGQDARIGEIGVDLALLQGQKALVMLFEENFLAGRLNQARFHGPVQALDVGGGAAAHADALAGQIREILDVAALGHQEHSAGEKIGQAEIDHLFPCQGDGRRSDADIHRAVDHQRDAGLGVDRLPDQFDRFAEAGTQGSDDLLADIDPEAGPLALGVDIPEGNGAFAKAHGDLAGFFDFF